MPYDLLTSKKFIASIIASALAFAGLMYGMEIAEIAVIVAPLTGYTLSQGLADFGKESK
jgi:hypothetical protein